MDWRTWSMQRAALVARSTGRRRTFKLAPQQPPDALVTKYTRAYDAAVRLLLFRFAQHAWEMHRRRTDAVMPLVKTIGDLLVHYADEITQVVTPIATKMVDDVNDHNLGGMAKVWRQVVGLPFTDKPSTTAALAKARKENVDLIKGMASDALARVMQALDDTQGQDASVVQHALHEAVGVGAARARLIARDQTLKINGNLTKVRHEGAGITKYEWVTSQDERVRPAHRALNGKEFEWDKPPVVDLKRGRHEHPGGDYQCRCIANPVIDLDALDTPDPVPAPRVLLPSFALPQPTTASPLVPALPAPVPGLPVAPRYTFARASVAPSARAANAPKTATVFSYGKSAFDHLPNERTVGVFVEGKRIAPGAYSGVKWGEGLAEVTVPHGSTLSKLAHVGFDPAAVKAAVTTKYGPTTTEVHDRARASMAEALRSFGLFDRDVFHERRSRYIGATGTEGTEAQKGENLGGHTFGGGVSFHHEVMANVASAMTSLQGGVALTQKETDAVVSLIHEIAHGASPITEKAWSGDAAGLDEMATELTSRRMVKQLGLDESHIDKNTYREEIDASTATVASHFGLNASDAEEALSLAAYISRTDNPIALEALYSVSKDGLIKKPEKYVEFMSKVLHAVVGRKATPKSLDAFAATLKVNMDAAFKAVEGRGLTSLASKADSLTVRAYSCCGKRR